MFEKREYNPSLIPIEEHSIKSLISPLNCQSHQNKSSLRNRHSLTVLWDTEDTTDNVKTEEISIKYGRQLKISYLYWFTDCDKCPILV